MVSEKKELNNLTEKDFEDAPYTEEPDGSYQFIVIDDIMYFRNMETGEIS